MSKTSTPRTNPPEDIFKSEFLKIFDLFLLKGADINLPDKDGKTPLHYVGHETMAQLLIARGAKVNTQDALGQTPLHRAYNIHIVKVLLDNGACVNVRDKDGFLPEERIKALSSSLNHNLKDTVDLIVSVRAERLKIKMQGEFNPGADNPGVMKM